MVQAKKEFTLGFMDMLTAPILTFSSAWADSIPDRLLKLITMERLVQGMLKLEYAGDAECVAYIMTRTFESPLNHDWCDVYTHLSCIVCEKNWKEDHWEQTKAPRKLTDWQEKQLLMPLRLWIYKRRRMHVKDRMKGNAPTKVEESKYEQLSMELI